MPNNGSGGGRRVVITGAGVISPLGNALPAFWEALAEGRSGVGDLSHLALDAYRTRIGGAVRDFNPRQFIADPKALKLMTRPVRLGVAAMELAVADAGLPQPEMDPFRIGCYVGSPGHAGNRDELLPGLQIALGDRRESDTIDLGAFGASGIAAINPLWLLKSLANLVLYFVSLKLGAQGPNANICMSGAGGALAVGEAFRAIRADKADVAVAGGYESLLDEERLESFETSGLLYLGNGDARAASRPFDRRRAGFVAAEGGAFLVLEELESARRRGARIRGELLGYGTANAGVGGRPNETSEAFAASMEAALGDARLDAWELSAIFAHGMATDRADRAEATALRQVLAARAAYVPIAAVKSMTGNLLAGSGPLEAIAALGTLQPGGVVPPILNCQEPDPDLGLNYVRDGGRRGDFRRVLLNAAGLGGAVVSLVLGRCEGA